MTIELLLIICSAAIVIAGGFYYAFQKKKSEDGETVLKDNTEDLDCSTGSTDFAKIAHNSDLINIFVINPIAAKPGFSAALSKKLESIENFDYFIFYPRFPGDETDLIKRAQHFFSDAKLRVYCCGGSGTFRNVLTGIENFDKVEMAFLPCGLTNDFLKTFDCGQAPFENLDNLIDGDIVKVDYIKTNSGLSLNSLSTGIDAITLALLEEYRFFRKFGTSTPYVIALLLTFFLCKPVEYEITIDGNTFVKSVNQFFFGNGNVLGGMVKFFNHSIVDDGFGGYAIGGKEKGFRLINVASALIHGNYLKIDKYFTRGQANSISIKRVDGKPIAMDFDGEYREELPEWHAEIVKQGLSFVVPKGVKING